MAKYNFDMSLSTDNIESLCDFLNDYIKNNLPSKLQTFVDKLSDVGIKVARQKASGFNYTDDDDNFASAILFTKDLQPSVDNCKCIITMSDKMTVSKSWLYYGQVKTEEISPSLISEFGSGMYASSFGMQGTFPRSDGQPSKGSNPPWHWMDLNGNWHTSIGTEATRPLFNAYQEMTNAINQIAREVFEHE